MCGVRSATRANLPSRYAFSLVSAPLPNAASDSAPWRSRNATSVSATTSSAASQLTGASAPSAVRISGLVSRAGCVMSEADVKPLMHICPRLTGKSGSAWTVSSCGAASAIDTVIPH
jgi:hypothetical protein